MLVRDIQLHLQNMQLLSKITIVGKVVMFTGGDIHWCTVEDIPKEIHDWKVTFFNIEYDDKHGIFFRIHCKKGETEC